MPPATSLGVSFGFGLSGTTPAVGSSASGGPSSVSMSNGLGTPSSGGNKRQRSESPPLPGSDDSFDMQQPHQHQTMLHYNDQQSNTGWQLSHQALPKRLRAGLAGSATQATRRRNGSTPPSVPLANTVSDVGRVLASLDKNSLLAVFSRLLTSDPSLAERVQCMIPTPSLSSVEASLEEAQRAIRSASLNASEMRAEFAWGRLRMPVADFTTTALGFLPFFVERKNLDTFTSTSTSSPSPSSSSIAREAPHPSTTFSYLQLVTERAQQIMSQTPPVPTNLSASLFSPDATSPVVSAHISGTPKGLLRIYQDALPMDKISAVNPNTVVSQLVPVLLLQWAEFVDAVSRSVNDEGRMFGAETVRSWLMNLETLAAPHTESSERHHYEEKDEQKACRAALFAVGQRLHEQIGWLVGRQFEWRSSPAMEL